MDINMPHMNGIETTLIIKKDYPKIIIIGCSAFSDVETKFKAQEAGMENYIEKPIAKKRLEEIFG
jgi:CheY-like chemotaxis protein